MIRVHRVHFVGIGGAGMSGIAEILLSLGYEVSGSDLAENAVLARLRGLGARITIGHDARNVGAAEVCVFTSAASPDNAEIREAQSRRIPVIPRAEMLAEIARLKHTVAIGGTHGKTTTTTMTASVLSAGGLDPTVIVGGCLPEIGSGARSGTGGFFVVEADESDGSFLKLHPTVAVATNIDDDHLDHYHTMEALSAAFETFLGSVPFYGFAVVSGEDERLRAIAGRLTRSLRTYAVDPSNPADVAARGVALGARASFSLEYRGEDLGPVTLRVPGRHNVSNALAAAAVGLELGVSPEAVRKGLEAYNGVDRRLQERGRPRGIRVIDDYGHHPTEAAAVFEALRDSAPPGANGRAGRLLVVFQPHRFTRTRLLADKFSDVLSRADRLFLLPVYPAGERPIPGVDRRMILDGLARRGYRACEEAEEATLPAQVAAAAEPGDTVLLLGAGSVTRLAPAVVAAIEGRPAGAAPGAPAR